MCQPDFQCTCIFAQVQPLKKRRVPADGATTCATLRTAIQALSSERDALNKLIEQLQSELESEQAKQQAKLDIKQEVKQETNSPWFVGCFTPLSQVCSEPARATDASCMPR